LDSQTVKPTKAGSPKADDRRDRTGARKRLLLVDTLGLIRRLATLLADMQDWDRAHEVVRRYGGALPRKLSWDTIPYTVVSLKTCESGLCRADGAHRL
jgi:hypothetical protein